MTPRKQTITLLHVDGVTKVKATAFIHSTGVSTQYRRDGVDWTGNLTFEEAKELGVKL